MPCSRFGFPGDAVVASRAQQGVCSLSRLSEKRNLADIVDCRESNTSREMWQHTSQEVRLAKACMQPVLKNWLLVSNDGKGLLLYGGGPRF